MFIQWWSKLYNKLANGKMHQYASVAKRPLNGFPYHVERIDTCGQMAEHGE